MTTTPLSRAPEPLRTDVQIDDVTRAALLPFDLDPDASTEFYPWLLPDVPQDFGIGLIVGASGSGKSTLLRAFGEPVEPSWGYRVPLVHGHHFSSPADAADRLYAVGLNSVPVWRQPYRTLSNGQAFRADLARVVGDGAVVDEFTSVVDRTVAASASRSLRAWADRRGVRRMVLATVHRDVAEWLRPDWLIDTDAGVFTTDPGFRAPLWWAEFATGEEVARVRLS